MDFLSFEGETIFVVNDTYSKWIETVPMKYTTAEHVIRELRIMFASQGLPRVVVTDNGPPFQSVRLADFMKENGIIHKFAATYHPSTNGSAERTVRTVKSGLRKLRGSVELRLARFLLRNRTTPHSSTGVSPAKLLNG